MDCQGTDLVWLDLNEYCSDPEKLETLMVQKAGIITDEGYIFGPEGNGFERINAAARKSTVEACMKRIKAALDTL